MLGEEGVQILRRAKELGLFTAVVAQLNKDFSRAHVAVKFDAGFTPEEVVTALYEKLYQLQMERFSDYLNVLYMVDVREQALRKVAPTDAVEVAGAVSVLVIAREWEKVQVRRKMG